MRKGEKVYSKDANIRRCIFRVYGQETPERIACKFCLVIGTLQDIITCDKFGDDRLSLFIELATWRCYIIIPYTTCTVNQKFEKPTKF